MPKTQAADNDDELLSPSEVAELLHKTEAALGQWRYQRKGPRYVKVGERVFYQRSAIRDYLDSRTVSTH
jgi:predicted DNA-binding transcriptional regulator AlpA